jgi:prostaglandin-H2 D-isomerase / glutathione transferase
MARPKLTYFDFHGGRGEPARLAFAIGGVAFDDDRVPFADWPARKPGTPFGGLPVLAVDGEIVSQSNAVNRYVGKLTGLYPTNPWQAAICDEVMDAIEDVGRKVEATFDLPEDEKKARRLALADGAITFYLTKLQERLQTQGGSWFAGHALSVADLKVFVWIRHLRSGKLDHVPTDLADRVAPKLVAHAARVANHPAVKAYYSARGVAG